MGGWIRHSLGQVATKAHLLSPITSLLALLTLKLPGLIPLLTSSATPSVPSSFSARLLQVAHARTAALWKAGVALGVAGIMVSAAFAGMPAQVHAPAALPHPISNTLPVNDSTPFFPYLVPGSDYPAPMNLTPGGNLSLPRMASTVEGGVPVLHLLVISTTNGVATPILLTGQYSEEMAREIQEGSSCLGQTHGGGHGGGSGKGGGNSSSGACAPPAIALAWSPPENMTLSGPRPGRISVSAPVTGDAFSTSSSHWAIALSFNDSTSLWVSNNSGANWTFIASVPGVSPEIVQGLDQLLMVTATPTGLALFLESSNLSARVNPPMGSFLGVAPVLLPHANGSHNATIGLLGITTNDSVVFDRSNTSGVTWMTTLVGDAPPNSTSPIFDRIGSTSLAAPGGHPDQITAVASGNDTVALWTASFGGRVVPMTAASGDEGVTWTGPYEDGGGLGSVSVPSITLTPAGYILGSWRNSLGAVEFQAFGLDGRALTAAQDVSPEGLPGASSLTFTVDALERPFFAWVPINDSLLQVTGALLHSEQAVNAWLSAVQNLTADDLANGNNSSRSALVDKLAALSHMVEVQQDPTGAIEKIEQDIIPKVTSEPLVLGCTGSIAVCGHLHRGQNPSWIVNGSDPLDANVFLAIYGIWALEALGVQALIPAPDDAIYTSVWTVQGCTVSGPGRCETLSATATAQVAIAPADPTDANVSASMNFPTLVFPNVTCYKNGNPLSPYVTSIDVSPSFLLYGLSVTSTIPGTSQNPVSLSPNDPFFGSVQGLFRNATPLRVYFSGGIDSPYGANPTLNVTACPGIQPGNNNDNFAVTLLQGAYPPCGGSPQTCNVEFGDEPLTFSTEQNATPVPPALVATTCADCNQWNLTANGTANVPSRLFSNITLSPSGASSLLDSFGYQNNITANVTLTTAGKYSFSGEFVTHPGGWCIQFPLPCVGYDLAINYGGPGGSSPSESTPFQCGFTLVHSNLEVENLTVSNVTATTADISWSTTGPAGTELTYSQVGTGNVSQVTTPQFGLQHKVHLAHLEPFALYSIRIASVLPASGCVTQKVIAPIASFQTSAIFPVTPTDLPYDSITKEGGGEQMTWPIPKVVVEDANLVSGNLEYYPAGSQNSGIVIPITSEKQLFLASSGQTLNETWLTNVFTNLTPQTVYFVQIQLNFSYNETHVNVQCNPCNFTAESEPFSFDYLKDTSGDGLADSEKAWGWPMSYVGIDNQYHEKGVWALGSKYATNGLTSDYVEKEFGLNPFEVDSTGSGMMDLWNLTFLVGQNDLSGFNLWYENQTDPFNYPQAPGAQATGLPQQSGLNNVTDDSPGSAEILWSSTALQTFEKTVPISIVDGKRVFNLRATTGSYQGQPTLTVEGKLSWGANPLAASTYGDGVLDGARANPLGPMGVQVQILNWKLKPFAPQSQGIAVAAFVHASNESGINMYDAYTDATFTDNNGFTSFPTASVPFNPFVVTFPVDGAGQYAFLNVSLAYDAGGCACVDISNLINSPVEKVDLLDGGTHTVSVTGTAAGWFEYMNFSYSVVRVTERAPTLLWVPVDNSTLSNLPTGLQRYTGEQDFDLMVVNNTQSTPVSVQNVPEPYGMTSYTATLQPGLNNILVPRGEFLSSPLGQSLLNNSGLDPKTQHTPLDFVASEWLNRIQNLSVTNPNYIALYTNTANDFSCSGGANCGTDPQNPAVEQGNTALQVQAVFTLNVSTSGDFANLMGGLLQNYSGDLTGSLQDVTNELPTLGLTAPILSALANATLVNDGAYSQPISKTPSTTPSWLSSIASVVWNTVSGVAHAVSIVWNYAVAAAAYLYHAAVSLAQHLADTIVAMADHAISALKQIVSAMMKALEELASYILSLVTSMISGALKPLLDSAKDALMSTYSGYALTKNNNGVPTPAAEAAFGEGIGPILVVAAALAVVVVVAVDALLPEAVVLGPLPSILIGIVITALGVRLQQGLLPSISVDTSHGTAASIASLDSNLQAIFDPNCVNTDVTILLLLVGTFSLVVTALGYIWESYNEEVHPTTVGEDEGGILGTILAGLAVTLFFVAVISLIVQTTVNLTPGQLIWAEVVAFVFGLVGVFVDLAAIAAASSSTGAILGGIAALVDGGVTYYEYSALQNPNCPS